MTWYASQLYVEPKEPVLTILKSHPVLCKGLYWIKDLHGHHWPTPMVRHGLPADGLFVVRELCDPTLGKTRYDIDVEAQWHASVGNEVVPWTVLTGPQDLSILMPPTLPIYAFGSLDTVQVQTAPPASFLCYLKQLAISTQTTVSFYHHKSAESMAVQQEYAWIFGEHDCVYVSHGPNATMKYTPAETKKLTTYDTVLMHTLRRYGLNLSRSYFAPHTRRFSWGKHRFAV